MAELGPGLGYLAPRCYHRLEGLDAVEQNFGLVSAFWQNRVAHRSAKSLRAITKTRKPLRPLWVNASANNGYLQPWGWLFAPVVLVWPN
ncbi:hypothetical protein [uncultured Planktomarina sp.]|uniref:hypothetical protein n=1 Tax=uncultured Planktomarina sp. TaxID=1538529 RepID=UPI003260E95F